MSGERALACRGVTVGYGGSVVLDGLDLVVDAAETVALLGPSGSGKTTLLYAVAGLLGVDAGEIAIAETTVAAPGFSLSPESRSVGMVFQNYALWPHLTATDTVAYPMLRRGLPRVQAERSATRLLDLVGIGDLGERLPDQLSGGQQQRVGLARALAAEPALYLFDEPTAHLDAGLRSALQHELVAQRRRTGSAALYTTHDAAEALAVADRIAVLREGSIVQIGTPQQVYDEPVDAWTAGLTGHASVLRCDLAAAGDGVVELDVGGRHIRVPGGASGTVGEADLIIRPEWAVLGGEQEGTVEQIVYEGPHTDYLIATPEGSVRVRRPGPPVLDVGVPAEWSLRRGWAVAPAKGDRSHEPPDEPEGSAGG